MDGKIQDYYWVLSQVGAEFQIRRGSIFSGGIRRRGSRERLWGVPKSWKG